MLTPLWPVFQTNSRLLLFLLQIIFSHTYAHTVTCALFFRLLDLSDEWTEGQKKDGWVRGTTGANLTFFS